MFVSSAWDGNAIGQRGSEVQWSQLAPSEHVCFFVCFVRVVRSVRPVPVPVPVARPPTNQVLTAAQACWDDWKASKGQRLIVEYLETLTFVDGVVTPADSDETTTTQANQQLGLFLSALGAPQFASLLINCTDAAAAAVPVSEASDAPVPVLQHLRQLANGGGKSGHAAALVAVLQLATGQLRAAPAVWRIVMKEVQSWR